MVAEDDSEAEECLSLQAQPARETTANAARQEKIKFLIINFVKVDTAGAHG
jgi:hypothetical protein